MKPTQNAVSKRSLPTLRLSLAMVTRMERGLVTPLSVSILIVIAIGMRLYHLDFPFDRDGYDEGVYWQTLRSISTGNTLYQQIFYSQPPFFMLSTIPGYILFGSSIWSARLGIALVSLLGLL